MKATAEREVLQLQQILIFEKRLYLNVYIVC